MGPTSAIPEPIVSSNDVLIQNHIAESVSSPEKAGVGGSGEPAFDAGLRPSSNERRDSLKSSCRILNILQRA